MKISKSKIQKDYRDILALYRADIKTLDQDERIEAIDLAKSYYNYLVSHDIAYGTLALDVIENKGQFGQIANIHLKHQSIFEGISPELITIVREQIIIRLAYKDTKMRSQTSYQQNDPCYKLIEDYHEEVFNQHTTI